MRPVNEYDIRQAERYIHIRNEARRHSEGLAGYITCASALALLGVFFFDAGRNEPFLPGIALAGFICGGAYWLYIRSEIKRLDAETYRIEERFREMGFYINIDGSLSEIPKKRD